MRIQQKLNMRQSQGLVMTPQLSQSIKLLTLSNIELSDFVENEIERNPFLERDNRTDGQDTDKRNVDEQIPTPSAGTSFSSTPDPSPNPSEDNTTDLTSQNELETGEKNLEENIGMGVENVYPDERDYIQKPIENARSSEDHSTRIGTGGLQLSRSSSSHDQQIADYTANQISLRDHLLEQLAIAGVSAELGLITTDMIDNLDDAGYLRSNVESISKRLGCSQSKASKALALLQSFEPTGIGAGDLAECLRLQLRDKDHLDPAMAQVVDNLDLLAKRDFTSLKTITGLDMEDLHDVLVEIQSLDPKPGTKFETNPIQHVVPDVFVREAPDGSWVIELNSETLPRVLVNNNYITEVGDALKDDTSKEFVAQCLQTANWLTKSLDQRAQTILKVAREIVKRQDKFLVKGVNHLRPLTLKMVADEIDMHESSVSRVTSNKYMMTPRGLFELKYFFTTSISGLDGEKSHSSESVRAQIKSLIELETANAVLSDDAIVKTLKENGIDIARRTIAKYRDAMHIPSSIQRRREKKAQAQARNLDQD